MRIVFSKYERVAGLFVIGAVASFAVLAVGVAIKKGFFQARTEFATMLTTGEGLRQGTDVVMQGLRIGAVTEVKLVSADEVRVRFDISQDFRDKIRADSVIRVLRPFVIGDKVLDITVGSVERPLVADGGVVPSIPTADVMDLLSGRSLGPAMLMMGKMAENLKLVAEAFLDPKRTQSLIAMFDELTPLMRNASSLTKEANSLLKGVNKDQQLVTVVKNLVAVTNEVNKLLPLLSKESPELIGHLAKIARNTAILTDEVQKTLPLLQSAAPEIPRASRRALEALDETVITLKALQKSFLLSGSAKEVREEESKKNRQPTQAP